VLNFEHSRLTSRLFNGRQVRKTLTFSKDPTLNRAPAVWEDRHYNLIRPHNSLRQPTQGDAPGRWPLD
jgi:hypothetical protein